MKTGAASEPVIPSRAEGIAPPPALDARDAAFVEAYIRTGNATDACNAAGIQPRLAKRTLANPDIQSEIARRQALSATENAVDESDIRERLIRETDNAIAAARDTGNLTALATHIKQRAMLSGLANIMSGDDPGEQEAAPVNSRDTARAVIQIFREGLPEGWTIGFAGPGETLLCVPEALAATAGGKPAHVEPVATIETVESTPDRESFSNGASIVFGSTNTTGKPILEWAVYGADGFCFGTYPDRERAAAEAKRLVNKGNVPNG